MTPFAVFGHGKRGRGFDPRVFGRSLRPTLRETLHSGKDLQWLENITRTCHDSQGEGKCQERDPR